MLALITELQNIINSIFNNITSVRHKNEYELLFQSQTVLSGISPPTVQEIRQIF